MQGPENPWPEPHAAPPNVAPQSVTPQGAALQPGQQGLQEGLQQGAVNPLAGSAPGYFVPSSPIPSPTGEAVAGGWAPGMDAGNTSGMGAQSVLPDELKGFNIGAFGSPWIWTIGNQFWLGLLVIPAVGIFSKILSTILFRSGGSIGANLMPLFVGVLLFGLLTRVFFGMSGNAWAWKSRRWNSVQHFRDTQRVWAIWGTILFLLWFLCYGAFLMMMPIYQKAFQMAQQMQQMHPNGQFPPPPQFPSR